MLRWVLETMCDSLRSASDGAAVAAWIGHYRLSVLTIGGMPRFLINHEQEPPALIASGTADTVAAAMRAAETGALRGGASPSIAQTSCSEGVSWRAGRSILTMAAFIAQETVNDPDQVGQSKRLGKKGIVLRRRPYGVEDIRPSGDIEHRKQRDLLTHQAGNRHAVVCSRHMDIGDQEAKGHVSVPHQRGRFVAARRLINIKAGIGEFLCQHDTDQGFIFYNENSHRHRALLGTLHPLSLAHRSRNAFITSEVVTGPDLLPAHTETRAVGANDDV